VRVSRWLRQRVAEGRRGVVVGLQRRACQVAVDGGTLLILSRPGVPLAPNALTLDVEPRFTLEDSGLRVGQAVALGACAPADRGVDWRVTLGTAPTWEPRPRVHRVDSHDLAARLRATRVAVIGEGAVESLLPLLWMSGADAPDVGRGLARRAGPAARRLRPAALDGDAAALARAARDLAGLGPGLTPSGDDLLAGFAAAWTLVGESRGLGGVSHRRVTDAIRHGGAPGASPLGRAWLEHACRGELPEPMTGFVGALLAERIGDLSAAARGALAVGASSGTDWMVGFLLGADAVLEVGGADRPW
jgi:hypothetical protein